jgi:glycosyltransferase involved in cell wall biosynthesis
MCPLAAVVLSWFRRIQITYWVMDLNPDQMIELGKARPTDLQVRIFEWLNRQILRRARAVVALDRFMAERLNRKMDISSKLVVLPPWPLEDHVEPISHEENPFRRQHGLEGKIVIMYSGNLSLASPVDTLLEAAGRVTDLENLLFLFVGGGLLKQQVDELIATGGGTNLRTLPYQPLEDLRYSLSAADVHLVAIGEKIVGICHPCKIYGAMAAARPILSLGPAACHAGDILADRNIGWSVAHGDVQRMEAVIRKIHGLSTEHRKEMGDEARRMINEQFSKERICGQFLAIVEHGPRGDAARREQESSQLPVLSRG